MEFREKIETALAPLITELRTKLTPLPTLDVLNNYQLQIDAVQTDKKNVPDGFMFKWRYLWALSLSADFRDGTLGAKADFQPIDQLLERIYDTYSLGAVYDAGRVRGSEREFLARLGLGIRVREPDVLAFPEQIRDWGRKRLEPFNESYFLPKLGKVETRITEIAIQIILTAELQYREGTIRSHEWRVQRKGELEEEEREKKCQAERAERERQKRLEQARIDRLLKSAAAFQRAEVIRKYVEAIRSAQTDNSACSREELEGWSQWALAEADRIDPVVGCKFLLAMRDE
jgi:hypothetical protein